MNMSEIHSATVKVIKDGRITIPQEIRELEKIKEGDYLKVTIEKIARQHKQ
jgi:AbrB family looped-hinge helix DNA binding protein